MVHAILLYCMMLAGNGIPAEAAAKDRPAYEAAAAKAGKNAAAHVQLALWCETHGMPAERIKHLDMALSLDPSNALARGLYGLVTFQGKWAKPDQVKKDLDDDPKLHALFRDYLERRVRTPQKNADAQLRLAAWCLENGLKDEAMAHYHVVTGLDPSRDIAWLHLGYKKHRDRWVKPEDLAAQKLESDRQKRADTQWKSRLEKLRDALESSVATRRLKAEKDVYQITDPRAVPMIWKVLAGGSEPVQLAAVALFSQIEGPAASFCLALMAVDKTSPVVREQAAHVLKYRDPRDVIGRLIALIHKPYNYQVKPATTPGAPGLLFVDGERFDLQRFYRFPQFDTRLIPTLDITLHACDPPGMEAGSRAVMSEMVKEGNAMRLIAAAQNTSTIAVALEATQERIDSLERGIVDDVRLIEETNAQINETNDRLIPILASLTGQNLGVDRVVWQKWWSEQLGYVYDDRYSDSKTSLSDIVDAPQINLPLPIINVNEVVVRHSCFAAGTLVNTLSGPQKIESITVGDRVLSQHTTSGVLSYQPVLATHLTGPAATFRISLAGETIVATGIHRFWTAGKGWTMARDLKAGDRLRMLGGVATINSIEPGPTQMVYNLNVAENRDFMVGSAGLLVHDYGFVLPVSEPFDRLTNAAPIASR
jgi:tetratricopeptide (TPR) repeat protein